MIHIPYLWKGNLFCEDDIVPAFTAEQPWQSWVQAGNSPHDIEPEEAFELIAEHLKTTMTCNGILFPLRLDRPPEPPSFCSVCLNWYT